MANLNDILSRQFMTPAQIRNLPDETAKSKTKAVENKLPDGNAMPVNQLEDIAEEIYAEREAMERLDNAPVTPKDMYNILGENPVTLDASQEDAVYTLVREKVGCLIGAAGTGKTTTTKFLLDLLINGDPLRGIDPLGGRLIDTTNYKLDGDRGQAEQGYMDTASAEDQHAELKRLESRKREGAAPIVFTAYTGIATNVIKRNLPSGWHRNVMTIHSLLGYAPVPFINAETGKSSIRFEATFTKAYKFPWKCVVIDEASMLSTHLWAEIRAAAPDDCRFYFIGDLNQLAPTIGGKNSSIFAFAMNRTKVCELTTIHRQADPASNRIIETAHNILNGKKPVFDDPATNLNWRVIGFKLDNDMHAAHKQIVSILGQLRKYNVPKEFNPDMPPIYDPWRDRVMTPTNGYDRYSPGGALGQEPLNETLSQMFSPKGTERTIISFSRGFHKFAIGYRVMALKNEPPSTQDRVTNGMTGKIVAIEPNKDWRGDRGLVGNENAVKEERTRRIKASMTDTVLESSIEATEGLQTLDTSKLLNKSTMSKDEVKRLGGPASHHITVEFDSGTTRKYGMNSEVENLGIAYVSTVHKAQGSEAPTAIYICHHLQRQMLNRENFYTAVTRAKERLVILYTDFGMQLACAKQQIGGRTLEEKIARYAAAELDPMARLQPIRIYAEDK